jgi:hypothetical protein
MPSLKIRFILSNPLANSGDAIPLFWLSPQIAIHPIFTPCHYSTLSKQSDPVASSRKDYCKLLAL